MYRLAQLETQNQQLSGAIGDLAKLLRNISSGEQSLNSDGDLDKELEKAKARILAGVSGIRALITGPTDLLQHIAIQVYFNLVTYLLRPRSSVQHG